MTGWLRRFIPVSTYSSEVTMGTDLPHDISGWGIRRVHRGIAIEYISPRGFWGCVVALEWPPLHLHRILFK
jgi:hypothetical protein